MLTNDEKTDKFVAAIIAGAKVYAHPETAKIMREFLGSIEEYQWLDIGVMYAVDFGYYNLIYKKDKS